MRSSLSLAALLLLVACAMPPAPEPWKATGDIKPLKQSTRYVAYSTAWRAKAEKAYHEATAYLEKGVASKPAMKWAVVSDLDQTFMNNITYHIETDKRGAEYSPATWRAWVEERDATLIPGAAAFIAKVNALGGKMVFVTNRRDYEVEATEDNLAEYGIVKGRDYVAILPRDTSDDVGSKEARFARVPDVLADHGFPNRKVVAYMGDVEGDKPANLGCAKFFCIPQGGLYGENCH